MIDRFRREAQAAARLAHPNIVHAYDADQAGDVHFLVMEFVEGISLSSLLAEHGPLPIPQACAYIHQAALGLQHAFERGMVHRDVKPQNLMIGVLSGGVVSGESEKEPASTRHSLRTTHQVKILDFGLARFAQETAPMSMDAGSETLANTSGSTPPSMLTQIGTVMGTPDYIAPEQARDPHAADIRSDIYGLGCTLYDLLTGKPPFPEGTVMQKVIAHLERTPRPVTELRADVPAELARVVEKMLAKDPAERYQTPAEIADVLIPFCCGTDGSPAQTERAGKSPAPRRRRFRPIFAAAGFVLIALSALLFMMPVQDFAHSVIRIATNKGLLIIEADEDLEITVKQAGKVAVAEVLNKTTSKVYELTAIDGEIEAKLPDGTRLKTTHFKLTRNGRQEFSAKTLLSLPTVHKTETGFQPLFNGKDLTGWTSEADAYFVKKDSSILANPVANDVGMLRTLKSYENYELRLQFRVTLHPEANYKAHAVVALHVAQTPNLSHGVQIKVLSGPDGEFEPQALRDVGIVRSIAKKTKGGEWNDLRVVCQNQRVTIYYNGEERWSCTRLEGQGSIGLWSVGRETHFRNVEIKELPAEPDFQPLFNGKNFDGWKTDKAKWSVKEGVITADRVGEILSDRVVPKNFRVRMEIKLKRGIGVIRLRVPAVGEGHWSVALMDNRFGNVDGTLHTGREIGNFSTGLVKEIGKMDQWMELEITAQDKEVAVRIGGKQVMYLHNANFTPEPGHIGLWIANVANPEWVELYIRKIEIMELPPGPPPELAFQPLFNGKDLNGWNGDTKTWAWKDGKLIGDTIITGHETREPAFLVGQKTYRDFELKFRARISNHGGVFCGVRVRGRATAQDHRVIGPVLDISKDIGGFYTNVQAKSFKPPQNKAELVNALRLGDNDFFIRCQGKRVIIRVNGVTTLDEECPDIPEDGVLAFELERFLDAFHQQIATFQDIQIRELRAAPEHKRADADRKDARFEPLFNGKDLHGWSAVSNMVKDNASDGVAILNNELIFSGTNNDGIDLRALVSNQTFDDFELKFRAKFAATSSDGKITLRLRTSMTERKQTAFSEGVTLSFRPKSREWRATFDDGVRQNITLLEFLKEADGIQWDDFNDFVVRFAGKRLTLLINQKPMADAIFDRELHPNLTLYPPIVDGRLAWTVHHRGTKLILRDVELKELPRDRAWQPLFKDYEFADWDGDKRAFRLWKDGTLECQRVPTSSMPILWSKKNYKDFELQFNAKFGKNANFLACTLRGQTELRDRTTVVTGPELCIGNGWDGTVYERLMKGTNVLLRPEAAKLKTLAGDELYAYHIRCAGKRVTIRINDVTVVAGDIHSSREEGPIVFQILGDLPANNQEQMHIHDIEVKELGRLPR